MRYPVLKLYVCDQGKPAQDAARTFTTWESSWRDSLRAFTCSVLNCEGVMYCIRPDCLAVRADM